mmetsp:Transcript_62487/g.86875  ORF Transcript_62487/g.86875 Transcript_62487/m.86875 type:complete len:208 (-) Transcript_62487:446-1069(-)
MPQGRISGQGHYKRVAAVVGVVVVAPVEEHLLQHGIYVKGIGKAAVTDGGPLIVGQVEHRQPRQGNLGCTDRHLQCRGGLCQLAGPGHLPLSFGAFEEILHACVQHDSAQDSHRVQVLGTSLRRFNRPRPHRIRLGAIEAVWQSPQGGTQANHALISYAVLRQGKFLQRTDLEDLCNVRGALVARTVLRNVQSKKAHVSHQSTGKDL